MSIRDLVIETWTSIMANKGRSFLTILGIVIGISSVIAMTSLIAGMRNMLLGELGFERARMVNIYPGTTVRDDDLRALQNGMPEYEAIAGMSSHYAMVTTSTEQVGFSLYGVSESYFDVAGVHLDSGRLFNDSDNRRLERVAIIGRGVNAGLFGGEDVDSIGRTIQMGENHESYTIIGIVSGDAISQQYQTIYIPAQTLMKRITGASGYDFLIGLVSEGYDVNDVCNQTAGYISRYFGYENEDQVYVFSMQEMIDELNMLMTGFAVVLTAIASISLFVGGIGIMNMMLTSVSERTREIGLRRSLGARTSDITQQFLSESIMLCLAGGFFGLVFGFSGAVLVARIISMFLPDTQFMPAIGFSSVAIAIIVCVTIGVIFGIYPARRAARLDPVESLRYQ
jgi:putative ABC transport system permease protein